MNNRKARLARTGKDARAAPEVENSLPEKQSGPAIKSNDSPESPSDDAPLQSHAGRDPQTTMWRGSAAETSSEVAAAKPTARPPSEFVQYAPGQLGRR